MRRLDIDEQKVLDLYEEHETARAVAEIVGCSADTVYRVLKKHDVPRTHRHQKVTTKRVSNCGRNNCWALVVMLRNICHMSYSELIAATGYTSSVVSSVICKRCPETKVARSHKDDFDIERMVHEYRDLGMTSYELADVYGVDPATIRKWMRAEGVTIGKENGGARAAKTGSGAAVLKERCKERIERKLTDDGGTLELLEYGEKLTLRCTSCGNIFLKTKGGYGHRFVCPECHARDIERLSAIRKERKAAREAARAQQLEAANEWRGSVARICKECGDPFFSEAEGACYCSERCRNRARNRRQAESKKARGVGRGTYRRRMRVEVTPTTYDRSVTLDAVYRKSNGVCCSCGRRTHRTKKYEPLQATLDHVVALANNGTHTWDNVQLLCSECNSDKRDLGQMRLAI